MTDTNEDIFTPDSDPIKTVDMGAKNAIEFLKDFTGSQEELDVILEGEERTTVLKAAGQSLEETAPTEPHIDPEVDRKNWPTIQLSHEDGKLNYEYLGASGTHLGEDGKTWKPFTHALQVMRGVPVKVPPSIVGMLQTSIEARFEDKTNPVTGRVELVRTERPALPWQLIDPGKYC